MSLNLYLCTLVSVALFYYHSLLSVSQRLTQQPRLEFIILPSLASNSAS